MSTHMRVIAFSVVYAVPECETYGLIGLERYEALADMGTSVSMLRKDSHYAISSHQGYKGCFQIGVAFISTTIILY